MGNVVSGCNCGDNDFAKNEDQITEQSRQMRHAGVTATSELPRDQLQDIYQEQKDAQYEARHGIETGNRAYEYSNQDKDMIDSYGNSNSKLFNQPQQQQLSIVNNPQQKEDNIQDYQQKLSYKEKEPISGQLQQIEQIKEAEDDYISLDDVDHLKDPEFKEEAVVSNHSLNEEEPSEDQDAPKDLQKIEDMNLIAPEAAKSIAKLGEFTPILESSNPTLPIYGPLKDPKTGATYKGQCLAGKKEGLGKEVYKNGSYYEGHWKKGQREGQGRFVSYNGDLFQGEFKNNKAEGKGTLYTADTETTYTGSFENDRPHGQGKEEYEDGSFYMGDFREGQMTGKCKFVFKDGGLYQGEVINGVATGKGKYTYKDSNKVYEGDFKNNKKHGNGTLTLDKYTYVGEFKDGQMQGKGTLTWKNGKKIIGHFENGVPEGEFEQVSEDGKVKKVLYEKGKKVKNL